MVFQKSLLAPAGACCWIVACFSQVHLTANTIPVLYQNQAAPEWKEVALPGGLKGAAALAEAATRFLHVSDEKGSRPLFPVGSRFDGVAQETDQTWLRVTFPVGVPFNTEDYLLEDVERMLGKWESVWPEAGSLAWAARYGDQARYVPLMDLWEWPEPPSKPLPDFGPEPMGEMVPLSIPHIPAQGQAQPTGALSGASVFLSPGHGWFYSSNLERWATQRPNTHQYIEDHGTGESVLQYLHQYLWNAGASVYTLRERCLNPNMVIVEQGGTGYSQTGSWVTENLPGAYQGTQRRASTVTGEPTATATYTPDIPEAGFYGVYVWYRRAGTGTTTEDASITVNHTGDSTTWIQNQNNDGFTWKYIGSYFFDEGINPETGSVTITNQSAAAGRQVIAGAVRFGGGMGDVPDPASGTVSGKPRWEESGRYYAGFMGVPNWENNNTVNAMPRMAAWEHEAYQAGRSVYVSWHTNAGGGTGTETFAFSSLGWNRPFNGVAGGDRLRDYLQQTAVRDFRAAWLPGWVARANNTANFGELNPNNNPAMPAALIEIAFHDNVNDVKYLLDPEFRRNAARAVYKGIVQYFANEVSEFNDLTYLPEPPRFIRAVSNAPGQVTLNWVGPFFSSGATALHGHQATGYRVYKSYNGRGFDNGRDVAETSFTFNDLEPGRPVYFRVSATNSGGESFPTSTLAVIPQGELESPRVLLVNGFSRLDRFLNPVVEDPHSNNQLQRGFLNRINTFDYVIEHAKAVSAFAETVNADSADMQAVQHGLISLGNYDAVIWIGGQQAQVNDIGNRDFAAINAANRNRLQTYLGNGGKLFISGSEIAHDLHHSAQSDFLRDVLKTTFVRRSAGGNAARGVSTSLMAEIGTHAFGSGMAAPYEVTSADVIEPTGGSSTLLSYEGLFSQVVEPFESGTGWLNPASAGQTNAAATTFQIVGSPVFSGEGAGRLTYEWGAGNLIRLFRQTMPSFPVDSNLTFQVFGDNSNHEIQIGIRDGDGEIWRSPRVAIDWTGWREVVWEDIPNNASFWALPGDGVVTGPQIRFDSIFLHRTDGGPGEGQIFFDHMVASPTDGEGTATPAGIAYHGNHQLVYLAYPFESIHDPEKRERIMARSLEFFGFGLSPYELWQESVFTAAQLADPTISGDFADPAGDGIPNFVKYALGLDPFLSSRDRLPQATWTPEGLEFTYTENFTAGDVGYRIQLSDELIDWRDAGSEVSEISRVEEDGVERVTVRAVPAISHDGDRQFIRLVVERD